MTSDNHKCCYKCKYRMTTPVNCHDYCKLYKKEVAVTEILRIHRNKNKGINEFESDILAKQQRRIKR